MPIAMKSGTKGRQTLQQFSQIITWKSRPLCLLKERSFSLIPLLFLSVLLPTETGGEGPDERCLALLRTPFHPELQPAGCLSQSGRVRGRVSSQMRPYSNTYFFLWRVNVHAFTLPEFHNQPRHPSPGNVHADDAIRD